MKMKKGLVWILALLLALSIVITGCNSGNTSDENDNGNDKDPIVENDGGNEDNKDDENGGNNEADNDGNKETEDRTPTSSATTLTEIPKYNGQIYIVINNNEPGFKKGELIKDAKEYYSPLDSLGRCGFALACLNKTTMPKDDEQREDISDVKPTGWVNKKYDSELVGGGYLYNRSHLIGWQLSAENANELNLITGTREMNQAGMLPFENMVADYLKEHEENHVMYRATPIFEGNNLVASGVHLEAMSVEDNGAGVKFNVYVFNVQPGIVIDYATGENRLESAPEPPAIEDGAEIGDPNKTYVLNTSSKKIHNSDCSSVAKIGENNKKEHTGYVTELIADGYTACGNCNPLD